jgi:NADH pyrophosphatase NudC (nudix superfamily)
VGIYELLVIDESIRSILRGAFKPDLVRAAARAEGMRRMQEDALEKLKAGMTTLEEITRVVPMELVPVSGNGPCEHEFPATYPFCPYCGSRRTTGSHDSTQGPSLRAKEGVFS